MSRNYHLLQISVVLLLILLLTGCNGKSTSITPEPEPEPTRAPSVVVEWNEATLAAVRRGAPRPTVISRALYIASAAMYDAWAVYDPVALPVALDANMRRPAAEHTEANQRRAVSHAAYAVLVSLFPAYEQDTRGFSTLLAQLGYGVNATTDPTLPAGIGNLAAQSIMEARAQDGSNAANNFADTTSSTFPELYQQVNSPDPTHPNSFGGPDFDCNYWCPLRVPTGKLVNPLGHPIVDHDDLSTYTDQRFLTPHWGAVTPFALSSGDALRPPGPPKWDSDEPYTDALGNTMPSSEAFRQQFDEVLEYSASLDDRLKTIAEYWADGPRSETPPGHWNSLAHGVSIRDNHGIEEDVKLFLALNGALMDAAIVAWDAKRTYNSCRPAAAVRWLHRGEMIEAWAGPNLGTQSIPAEEWVPYQSLTFVTPPFPDFISGHSTFSASAAEVLEQFTGSPTFYDGTTRLHRDYNRDGVLDMLGEFVSPVGGMVFEQGPSAPITLRWRTFKEAADEAGLSRLYGGIHHQDADLHGRRVGEQVGEAAFARASALWGGPVATEIPDSFGGIPILSDAAYQALITRQQEGETLTAHEQELIEAYLARQQAQQ